ncbi:putative nucleotidyltransferases [Candidatus Termititenax persephonae]|uniref:Nucleotidyltransferases n=1 Tax=Candidatus Termititenax persephonae TaxID=2218525 RepID=A0A388TGS5_9BACT|nr:putative nucleotidyltransferases [Candidatus Termititenax persephonae]
MLNSDILNIKDRILSSVDCQKIILFGSYAYGAPRADSDYDFYVVLDDGAEKPIRAVQKIYRDLAQTTMQISVDILANYKTRYEERSKLPTLERTVARQGIILYDRN